jgi:RimJ/RimL family protein N-acetyltransferase
MIHGERIRFRAPERTDIPLFNSWLNDPDIRSFETPNLNRVFLRVFENNPGAIRLYEKAGFMHEGCLRQAEYQQGKFLDVLVMGILRSEYKGS